MTQVNSIVFFQFTFFFIFIACLKYKTKIASSPHQNNVNSMPTNADRMSHNFVHFSIAIFNMIHFDKSMKKFWFRDDSIRKCIKSFCIKQQIGHL